MSPVNQSRRTAVLGALVGAWLFSAAPARADELDTKRQCAADHEQTQRRRLEGALVAARVSAIACAQETCPARVRVECIQLLGELDAAIPSVIVDAREPDGSSPPRVTITIDGGEGIEGDGGKPLALDPGAHVVRAVTPDGRAIEARFTLSEGEARRHVPLRLPAPRADAVAPPAPAKAPPPARDAARAPGRAWWPVVAFGGVAVAGLGTFTVAGLAGYREQILLESACAPGCAPGTDAGMRRAYLIADVGLAVSVVALVGALWLGLRSDPALPSSTRAR
ncbi:MAG TPA: hypothetical protein PK141_26605 [Polyangiaceae bacterium]|nr:hypothetical protein [Polyangiaceae bacterium]